MLPSIVYDKSASPEIEGGQKQIFRGEYHEAGEVKPCAVARPTHGYAQGMAEEVALWQEVCCPGHDNILRLYHFSKSDSLIAMELIDPIGYDLVALGTLYSYDNKMMPLAETADVFRKLISALRYMHKEKDVIHRDLKADQVLIAGNQDVKLTDFGLAVTVASLRADERLRPMPRSPGPTNIAPEIPQLGARNPAMYDGQVDLFGLGWILSQLYSDLLPRRGNIISEAVMRSECGDDAEAREILQDLAETRGKLIVTDPERRMTLDEMEARPWMRTGRGDTVLVPNLLGDTSDTSSRRSVLRKFSKRLVAVCAVLQSPFPRAGMLLKDIHSADWTCLLIEKPNGEYDTFPSADTKLELRQRIFFGCKPNASVQLTCASEDEVQTLIANLDGEGHISKDLTVGGTEVLEGYTLRNSTDVKVGAAVVFDYDPKLRLSRMLKLDFSDEKARQETYHALSPFSLEFDAFQFQENLVSPVAVLGPESCKSDDSQLALDFRSKYAINLAGIARPTDGKLEVEWMPGPHSLLCPGSFGLVVRKPTKSGITLPTVTCEKLVEMGLARPSNS
jgi:serine/threonine protein kinase